MVNLLSPKSMLIGLAHVPKGKRMGGEDDGGLVMDDDDFLLFSM